MPNKIVKNTVFLYIRMLLLMGIGFFTTRVVLEALGVEDLGIYNVVGSLIVMFDFVSSGLSNSTQRFLNIGIGKGDEELTKRYFSQSLVLHVVLALFITIVVETVGVWFVHNKLVIPVNRMDAALWVFHFSTISLALRLIKICFESDIIAREQMSLYAYLSVFEGVAKLVICYMVMSTHYDKLILYGFLLLIINLFITLFNILYCIAKNKETHYIWCHDKEIYLQLTSFIGINTFGVISWAIGKQGLNVLINLFFGPVVNGAKSVASNLDRVISQFGTNLVIAARPQVTQLYAQGQITPMVTLAMRTSKIVYYVLLVVSLPLFFETSKLLHIWLKVVPDFTAGFVRIMMIESLVYCIGNTFMMVTIASGRIKRTQLWGRLITLSTIPIAYILLHFWHNEFLPSLILALTSFLYSLYIIWDANTFLHFGLINFTRKVFVPIIIVTIFICLESYFLKDIVSIHNLFLNLTVNSCILWIGSIVIVAIVGLEKEEQQFVLNLIGKLYHKLK